MQPQLNPILEILTAKGNTQYGREAVSQLEHALQCATLAEIDDRSPDLITACLLHDLEHLLHDLGEDVADRGLDDRHEYRAMPLLQTLFKPSVTEPIRLHVDAKRYLCAVDLTYWESLSPASKRSLELQGGIFSVDAVLHRSLLNPTLKMPYSFASGTIALKLPIFQSPILSISPQS